MPSARPQRDLGDTRVMRGWPGRLGRPALARSALLVGVLLGIGVVLVAAGWVARLASAGPARREAPPARPPLQAIATPEPIVDPTLARHPHVVAPVAGVSAERAATNPEPGATGPARSSAARSGAAESEPARTAAQAPSDAEVRRELRAFSQPIATVGPPRALPVAGRAELTPAGVAVAPAAAPPAVAAIVAAANRIAALPYRYGGGHASFEDTAYDCSGSVSYALAGAGLLSAPLDSSALARSGEPGYGRWVTIFANAGHTYMEVAGLRFDTAGARVNGSRWQAAVRSAAGFEVRHPAGL